MRIDPNDKCVNAKDSTRLNRELDANEMIIVMKMMKVR
jgi:hypothetical protein